MSTLNKLWMTLLFLLIVLGVVAWIRSQDPLMGVMVYCVAGMVTIVIYAQHQVERYSKR